MGLSIRSGNWRCFQRNSPPLFDKPGEQSLASSQCERWALEGILILGNCFSEETKEELKRAAEKKDGLHFII